MSTDRVASYAERAPATSRCSRRSGCWRWSEMITSEGREGLLDRPRRDIACLFCDIRDFSR